MALIKTEPKSTRSTFHLSHLDKIYWPDPGITKAMTLHYFTQVSQVMLPLLKDRPLTVVRYPDGVAGHGFYQKDAPQHTPDWIQTHEVTSRSRTIRYILANDVATLLWLANQGAIEFHPWLSTAHKPNLPTYAVIDLDPTADADFADVRMVAAVAKEWLDRLELHGVPKTSGASGIHILIPLEPVYPYEVTSRFVGLLARMMKEDLPAKITTERKVSKRPRGTVYVDHLQNLPGKTIVSVYSPRPGPKATVSAPFPWKALSRVQPEEFSVAHPEEVLRWAQQFEAGMAREQRLEHAIDQLKRYLR